MHLKQRFEGLAPLDLVSKSRDPALKARIGAKTTWGWIADVGVDFVACEASQGLGFWQAVSVHVENRVPGMQAYDQHGLTRLNLLNQNLVFALAQGVGARMITWGFNFRTPIQGGQIPVQVNTVCVPSSLHENSLGIDFGNNGHLQAVGEGRQKRFEQSSCADDALDFVPMHAAEDQNAGTFHTKIVGQDGKTKMSA